MSTDRPGRGSDSDADLGDDRVRDDDVERDFGETEPADPLGQSMPDITQAHMAEAGGGPARRKPRSERGGDLPVNEVERAPHVAGAPRKGLFGRAADFLRASYAELRRVQWPDRRQVGQGTAVTLGFVVVAGAYLGLLDAIWNPIIQAIL
jgi:preprotein translocase SecE subunit